MEKFKLTNELKEEIEFMDDDDEIFRLATDYNYGLCVDQNYEKANKLFCYLMNRGNVEAQHCLGCNYKDGNGVNVDMTKAIELLKPIAENGYVHAMVDLGYCYEYLNKNKKAFELFEKAVLIGDTRALYNVARCYFEGIGIKKNYDLAYEYFTKIEIMNDDCSSAAYYYLGRLYLEEDFSGFNVKKGIEYLEKAIDKGCYWAYSELGILYIDGYFVKKDNVKGINYFKQGISVDDRTSCANLARAYETGQGIKRDYNQALKYYKKAIELGMYECKKSYKKILEKINNGKK